MTVLFSLLTAYHVSRWRSNHIAIMKSSINTCKFTNDSFIHYHQIFIDIIYVPGSMLVLGYNDEKNQQESILKELQV